MDERLIPLGRLLNTIRHIRPAQIGYRLLRASWQPSVRAMTGAGLKELPGWKEPLTVSQQFFEPDQFLFLNQRRRIGEAADWRMNDADRLWLYHLHYFDDLCSINAAARRNHHVALIERWLAENPPGSRPGWEPYPTSRRIVNWLKWHLAGGSLSKAAIDSLAAQVDFLSRSLEFHLPGNHLLANLKALIFGCCLINGPDVTKDPEKWASLLMKQLDEQVLADGGHMELSPMYHAVVLEDLLDIVNISWHSLPHLAEYLRPICAAMIRWLHVVTHPDGLIALFNDSAHDGCHKLSQLEEYAADLEIPKQGADRQPLTILDRSGIARMNMQPFTVIADIGNVGPDYLPGHAHADTLNFELSYRSKRVVVDTGTSTYSVGAARCHQRSTGAHNTLTIDGMNSSEVWSAFRVGHRARTFDVNSLRTSDRVTVRASHDGYERVAGIIHTRTYQLSEEELTVTDELAGHGTHQVEWLLHLHPDVDVRALGNGQLVLQIRDLTDTLMLSVDRQLCPRVAASTYHPEFGVAVENSRIVAIGSLPLPCRLVSQVGRLNPANRLSSPGKVAVSDSRA